MGLLDIIADTTRNNTRSLGGLLGLGESGNGLLSDLDLAKRNALSRLRYNVGKNLESTADYLSGDPNHWMRQPATPEGNAEIDQALMDFGSGLAGTIIGEAGAKRAGFGDLLALAKKMTNEGHKESDIYKATRSFIGPNGQWMHEISDVGSEIIKKGKNYFLKHPELEAAYPDVAKVPIKEMPSFMMGKGTSGQYAPHLNKLSWMLGDKGAVEIPAGATPERGTVLHEFQHWVQNHPENQWEYGSNPRMFNPERVMKEAQQWSGKPEDLSPTLENNIKAYGIEKNQEPFSAYEMYRRHWPEAMAVNTSVRMNLPADQLAENFWYDTLSRPRSELVSIDNSGFGSDLLSLLRGSNARLVNR